MPADADLARLQALLADALLAPDPVAFLRARSDAPPVDADGLRLAALLIAKLRFQRLLNGSAAALEFWQQDPAGFTRAFRTYHQAVPPTAFDPWREAEAFAAWCAAK
ncbi:MAG: hypothetical protein R3F56_21395 [Planctomycetota bacterium]